MKAREYIDEHPWRIIIIPSIIITLLVAALIFIDASRNIDDQIASLYEKEQLITQDFSEIYELSNVTCNINKENNVIVFREQDCSLTVKYSKNGGLITVELHEKTG